MVSFRAKPRANPVSPKPATRADTFMPKVPREVITPKDITHNLTDLAKRVTIRPSSLLLSPVLMIVFFAILDRIQNARKTITATAIGGAPGDYLLKYFLGDSFHDSEALACPGHSNVLNILGLSCRRIGIE